MSKQNKEKKSICVFDYFNDILSKFMSFWVLNTWFDFLKESFVSNCLKLNKVLAVKSKYYKFVNFCLE